MLLVQSRNSRQMVQESQQGRWSCVVHREYSAPLLGVIVAEDGQERLIYKHMHRTPNDWRDRIE